MKKFISVLIPCYNEERDLKRCLESLQTQSVDNYEVIVIDDGSLDKSRLVAQNFGVRLLEQNHIGPGGARNFGAKEAKGDILVFVDADMFVDEQFLELLTEPIQNGSAVGTFTKDEFVGNPDNFWAVCWNIEHTGSTNRRIREDYPDEATVFRAILRSRFLEVGGYDDLGYGEDVSLFNKLKVKSKNVSGAICYHNNPETLVEVFLSARYYGCGEKFSQHPLNLIKYSIPLSMLFALVQAFNFKRPTFFAFKLIHDLGVFWGGISRLFFGRYTK